MSSFIHAHMVLPRPFLSLSEPLLRLPAGEVVEVPSSRGKILFFLNGEALLGIDGQPPVPVRDGSLAILPTPCRQTYHSMHPRAETIHAYCIRFVLPPARRKKGEDPVSRDLAMTMRRAFLQPQILTGGVTSAIRQRLLLLRHEIENQAPGHEAMLYALVLGLCVETARSVDPGEPVLREVYLGKRKARNLTDSALEYMLRHLRQNPPVEKVAWALNVSAEHLCRVFRAEKGLSPREALRNLQMDEAINLLLHSSLEVYRVAERVGFGSVASFCRFFRGRFGMTPSEYRFANPEQFLHRVGVQTGHLPPHPAAGVRQ